MTKIKIIILSVICFIAIISSGFSAFLFMAKESEKKELTTESNIYIGAVVDGFGSVLIDEPDGGYSNHKIIFSSGDISESQNPQKGIRFEPYISFNYNVIAESEEKYDEIISKYNFYYYITFKSENSRLFNSSTAYAYLPDLPGQSENQRMEFSLSKDNYHNGVYSTQLQITPEFHYLVNKKPFNENDYEVMVDLVNEDINDSTVKYEIIINIVAEVKNETI